MLLDTEWANPVIGTIIPHFSFWNILSPIPAHVKNAVIIILEEKANYYNKNIILKHLKQTDPESSSVWQLEVEWKNTIF